MKGSLPEGFIGHHIQTETGLWAENNDDKMEVEFNNLGQLISLVRYHKSDYTNNSTAKVLMTYNADGFLTTRQMTFEDSRIISEKFEYQSGRLNKVLLTKDRDENYQKVSPFTITKTYQYDPDGHLTQFTNVDQNNITTRLYEYGYSNGILSSAKQFIKGATTEVEYVLANGRIAKRTARYQGKISFVNNYTYDSEGQNVRYEIINSLGTMSYWTLGYDNKKAPIDFAGRFFLDIDVGLLFDHLLFKGHPAEPLYGSSMNKHNILSVTDSDPLGRQQTYTYQYNSHGYPTEVIYSIYNGTQKATTNGKRQYAY